MENQLIQLYLLVCPIYDTRSETCFQRLSNNSEPRFTDQELVAIYLFAHLNAKFEKKAMHRFIKQYWRHFFPRLPAYQTFVARLNLLEQTFQTIGGYFNQLLAARRMPELDHLIDSMPVMLAKGGHAYTARVAREVASVGYCESLENLLSRRAAAHPRAKATRNNPAPHTDLAPGRLLPRFSERAGAGDCSAAQHVDRGQSLPRPALGSDARPPTDHSLHAAQETQRERIECGRKVLQPSRESLAAAD
jgi:hypothetical protein